MYKYLIIGIALMFTIYGGYYLNESGGFALIFNSPRNNQLKNQTILSVNDVTGLYVCDKTSGCKEKHILILKEDLSVEILILDDGDPQPENEHYDDGSSPDENSLQGEILAQNTPENIEEIPSISSNEVPTFSSTTPEENTTTITPSSANTQEEQGQYETRTPKVDPIEVPTETTNEAVEETSNFSNLLSSLQEKNPNSVLEKGDWDIDVQNMIVINIISHGTSTLPFPRKIVIKNVYQKSLSDIYFPKNIYTNMKNPVFFKKNT